MNDNASLRNHANPGAPGDTQVVAYARYSSDGQNATSIDDQAAACRAYAERHHLPPLGRVVSDAAVSVKDQTAPHWNELMEEVRQGRVTTVYVDEFSRVTRVTEELLRIQRRFQHYGASLISVHEDTDIRDEKSELGVLFTGYKNQAASRDSRHRIKRSMDGNLHRGLSNGDIVFGYHSVSLTEAEIRQRGLTVRPKEKRPPHRFEINESEAEVVRQIHRWFAQEKLSLSAIARELNKQKIPCGGKARKPVWRPQKIRKILESRRYLGYRYRNKTRCLRNPDTRKVEVRSQPVEDFIEVYESELAIIDQVTYDATQRRFEEVHRTYPRCRWGWSGKGGSRAYAPRRLLSGTLVCGLCGAKLIQAGGHQSGYYGCPNSKLGLCTNRIKANRRLTEELILEALREMLGNELQPEQILQFLLEELDRQDLLGPTEIAELRREREALTGRMARLTEAIELGGDLTALTDALKTRQRERDDLDRRLHEAERAATLTLPRPDLAWVKDQMSGRIERLLEQEVPQAALLLHEITGPIQVFSQCRPWLRQPHLVAKLQVDLVAACTAGHAGSAGLDSPPRPEGLLRTKEVPLRRMAFYEQYGARVVQMYDEDGKSFSAIARELSQEDHAATAGRRRSQKKRGPLNAATIKFAYNFGKYGTPDPSDRQWQNHCRRLEQRRAAEAAAFLPTDGAGPEEIAPPDATGPEALALPPEDRAGPTELAA